MRGIGVFVTVLLVAGGVAMFLYTRPPDRSLDDPGREWVDEFTAWSLDLERTIDRAEVSIGVSSGERFDTSLVPALEACAPTLRRLGPPSNPLLGRAVEEASIACSEIEHALAVYERYGPPALASTEQHLKRAARWLVAARFTIKRRLSGKDY